MSPLFIIGDELGALKVLRYVADTKPDSLKCTLNTVYKRPGDSGVVGVQALATKPGASTVKTVASAYSDGSACVLSLSNDDKASIISEWRETRMKEGDTFVGLAVSERGTFSCTSNGALRRVSFPSTEAESSVQCASLPTRLRNWRLHPNGGTFAYGGDEVEPSIWDTERAFQPRPSEFSTTNNTSKKRKRSNTLFPGEIWRAKTVPNDFLSLRQPVRITSLAYLSPTIPAHLLVGTELGDVRRYDTRTARRPVSEWKKLAKAGGIQVVEKGFSEHEAFVSDHGSSLYSIDLRNGKITYGYRGLSGSVSSIAPSPSVMVSTSLDRYARVHSVFPPPEVGQNQEKKGEVLEKVYLKSVPTAVVWSEEKTLDSVQMNDDAEDDELWNTMAPAHDGDVDS